METHQILVRPLASEKSEQHRGRSNAIVLAVHLDATKIQIRRAIEHQYAVKVLDVRTLVNPGKLKRRAGSVGRRPNWKKAIVTLRDGDSIDFFAGE